MKAIITNESKEQKALNDFLNEEIDNKIYLKDIHIASGEILQSLVDKSIPIKLKDAYYEDGIVESGYCPNCGLEQDDGDKDVHCRDCGQALDWSDSNE
jgi:hypothetical protein